jgi:hypothetical protein
MTALPVQETIDTVAHIIAIGGALILIVVAASIVSAFVVNAVQTFRTFRALCLLT